MKRSSRARLALQIFGSVLLFVGLAAWAPVPLVLALAALGTLGFVATEGARAEGTLAKALHSRPAEIQGLEWKDLEVYPDPSPNLFVAQGLFSRRPKVFLSQGLLAALEDRELRALLRDCRARSRGLRRGTLAAALAYRLSRLLPDFWVETFFGGKAPPSGMVSGDRLAWQFVGFAMTAPLIRWLLSQSATVCIGKDPTNVDMADAMQKIRQMHRLWPSSGIPAFRHLGVLR